MTAYETPVRVQVDPTPGEPTRVRLTLSAHDGECGMFEDVPVAWLRDQLAVSVPGPAGDVDLDAIESRRQLALTAQAGYAPARRPGQEALHKVLAQDVPALVAEVERLRAELDRQMPAALEAGEAIVDLAVDEAVAETEARMIARAEAAEAERDAAVARADTLAAQVDRVRALAEGSGPGSCGGLRRDSEGCHARDVVLDLRAALDGGGE